MAVRRLDHVDLGRLAESAERGLGKPVELHVIDAPYGHDCFLLEEARQTPIIRRSLGMPA